MTSSVRNAGALVHRLYRRFRVWRRRRKVKRAYAKIAEVEIGHRHGLTPVMRMHALLERDGWAEIEDGELRWRDDRVRYE